MYAVREVGTDNYSRRRFYTLSSALEYCSDEKKRGRLCYPVEIKKKLFGGLFQD